MTSAFKMPIAPVGTSKTAREACRFLPIPPLKVRIS